MSEKVYVLLDSSEGRISSASWEALALGQAISAETGYSLHPLVLGKEARSLAEQAAQKQAHSVLLVQDDKLARYDPDIHCAALRQILGQDQPYLLLMAHTYQNIDLAPKLSAAMKRGLVTDCIGYRRANGELTFVRQMFRSKINADIRIASSHPWIVTVQPGAFSSDGLKETVTSIQERRVDLLSVQPRRKVIETIQGVKEKVDLSKAEIIVAVGRGIKERTNLRMIEELAAVLDAPIAASRPVVDNEWLDRDRQIGSSGQTVAPRLYIACGISGAIQHIVGMKNSGCIVAINRDPNAPIFNVATYGIVGDVLEVVPALIRKLKEETS